MSRLSEPKSNSSGCFDCCPSPSRSHYPPIRKCCSHIPLSAVCLANSLQMSLLMADWSRKKHTCRPLNHLASKAICQLEGGDVEHLESTREQRCTAVASPTHKQRAILPSGVWPHSSDRLHLHNWAPHVSMIKTTAQLSFTLPLLS